VRPCRGVAPDLWRVLAEETWSGEVEAPMRTVEGGDEGDGEGRRERVVHPGPQYGIGPLSYGCSGPAAFCEDQFDEGLFFCRPRGVVTGETLYASHYSVETVRQEQSSPYHVF